MNQVARQIQRVTSSQGKASRRKQTEMFSHADKAKVEQWLVFMATCGWKLKELRQSSINQSWVAIVTRTVSK